MLLPIIAYLMLLLGIGIYYSRIRSLDEFIIAGKNLGFYVLVTSIAATFYGAAAVLGGAELAYYFGLGALWFMVPFYIGNLLVIPFLDKIEKSGAKTLPDFLGKYYDSRIVVLSSLLLVVLCLVPSEILAIGKIMNVLMPYSTEGWMIAITAVVILYTLLGGMRSVAHSDMIQFTIMALSFAILLPYALKYSPDFLSNVPGENLDPLAYFRMLPQDAIRWTILLLFLPITSSPLYMRFFASLKKVDRKKALAGTVMIYFAIDMILLSSGMIAYANSEKLGITEENADISLLILGLNALPKGLTAVFIVGLLAVMMSTADSWLHAGASSLAYDILKRRQANSESSLIMASRLFIIVLGVGSLLIALYFFDIIEALSALLTVWISGVLVPTMAALLSVRMSSRAAALSMILGTSASVLWTVTPIMPVDPLFVGIFFSLAGALLGRKQRI
ncbi:MAG: sodium:solute symporter family protein [Candidatus Altiarchaeota archaeon]